MPLVDILSAAFSGPAGRVVEGPVRSIVAEVLQDHGYASPAEVQALRDDLQALRELLTELGGQVEQVRGQAAALSQQAEALRLRAEKAEAAAEAATLSAAAATAALSSAAAARRVAPAERQGMSPADHDRFKAQGLPGLVGPDGHVSIDGEAWQVDPALAGRPYTLSKHKAPRVLIDGVAVDKARVG